MYSSGGCKGRPPGIQVPAHHTHKIGGGIHIGYGVSDFSRGAGRAEVDVADPVLGRLDASGVSVS